MKTSDIVRYALTQSGKPQRELAEYFGISTQAMSLKVNKNSWYVRELCNQVKDITGAIVIMRLPNGEEFEITDELLPGEKAKMEKAAKARAGIKEISKEDITSRFTIEEILAMYGKSPAVTDSEEEEIDIPLTQEELIEMLDAELEDDEGNLI